MFIATKVLDYDIARNFGAILGDAVSRSKEIMRADISALPGFYKPHAKEWNTVSDCKYAAGCLPGLHPGSRGIQ